MTRKEKIIRLSISGAFLVAIILTVATIIQSANRDGTQKNEISQTDNTAADNAGGTSQKNSAAQGKKEPASTNASSRHVKNEDSDDEYAEETTPGEETMQSETGEEASANVNVALNFTEDSLVSWPVNGTVLMDYSMDKSVYFSSLNVYKYNPALIIGADVDEPVKAIADSRVASIHNSEETGITVTLDMGNGYKAVYGQLTSVHLEEGEPVTAGTIIGKVNEPTKYYNKEGSNLYFAMSKDGQAVDPILFFDDEG